MMKRMVPATAISSVNCGQAALMPLDPSAQKNQVLHNLADHTLPPNMQHHKKNLTKDGSVGMEVFKITKTGNLANRRLAFSPNHRSLYITTNKITSIMKLVKLVTPDLPNGVMMIDISRIDNVVKGQLTRRFSLHNDKDMEATSLSILYLPTDSQSNSTMECLDLIVPNPRDYANLITSLDNLMELYQVQARSLSTSIRLLEYHFIDMGKNIEDHMTLPEFYDLCNRLNTPLKSKAKPELISSMYKELLKELKKTHAELQDLPIWAIAELLKDVEYFSKEMSGLTLIEHDPISKVWNETLSTDPVPLEKGRSSVITTLKEELDTGETSSISNVAFLSFIRSQQKEFKTNLDLTAATIQSLNQQISTSQDLLSIKNQIEVVDLDESDGGDRLDKVGFLNYLLADDNDLLDPAKGHEYQDMTYPLSSYWISTSHDSYRDCWKLDENGLPTVIDEQMYHNVLARGARCLELDVWDSPKSLPTKKDEPLPPYLPIPVICSQDPSSAQTLKLEVVLRIVRQFVLANPNCFPILLNIENHCSYKVQEIIADQLFEILGSIGLLVVPNNSSSIDEKDLLPSPSSMKGKVLVMGKIPLIIKEGSKVINDDYDNENDEFEIRNENEGSIDQYTDLRHVKSRSEEEDAEIEESKNGIVVGFDAAGPTRIRDFDPTVSRHTPGELLWMEQNNLESRKLAAVEAELKALEKADEADRADQELEILIANSGLSKDQVMELSNTMKGSSLNPDDHKYLLERHEEEGVEVQEFFGDAFEGAKSQFSQADANAIKAAEHSLAALQKLNAVTDRLQEAEEKYEKASKASRKTVNKYQRAAAGARSKQEDYFQMQERVGKLKEMILQTDRSASSADNVMATAETEAKISEKRAAETEARAARSASIASKDRVKADEETHKEEKLEKQASQLHDKVTQASNDIGAIKGKMNKAAQMLDRINEQIKLIEKSTQYIREKDFAGEEKKVNSPGPPGTSLAKHASKVEARQQMSGQIKSLSMELRSAEEVRRNIQDDFEKKAVVWKEQTTIAQKARKQADRSSYQAEELAEVAEEEREAATLRHFAREKAKSNVTQKDGYKESLKAQLAEAEKQAAEVKRAANQAKTDASLLTHLNDNIDTHDTLVDEIAMRKERRDLALRDYESCKKYQEETEGGAADARRLFLTSETVYNEAMRNASADEQKKNVQDLSDRKIIVMLNAATLGRKQAEHALEEARYAQTLVAGQEVIVRRAKEYKVKTERISEIPPSLAKMTFLHTARHRYWEKSFGLSNTNVHSFAQGVLDKMTTSEPKNAKKMKKFTIEHICRTFPSWKDAAAGKLNSDPLHQWAMGCQLVSMNMNSFDEHVLKVDGRFRSNGSCGYVLKPPDLRRLGEFKDRAEKWHINILCGSYLPSPMSKKASAQINPYVKISVYNYDNSRFHHKTEVVGKNGLNPVWNDAGFDFKCNAPFMGMLVFTVWDKSPYDTDDFIGASAMPISCIREGYRSVPLFDRYHTRAGAHAFASLLVKAKRLA